MKKMNLKATLVFLSLATNSMAFGSWWSFSSSAPETIEDQRAVATEYLEEKRETYEKQKNEHERFAYFCEVVNDEGPASSLELMKDLSHDIAQKNQEKIEKIDSALDDLSKASSIQEINETVERVDPTPTAAPASTESKSWWSW